MQARFLRVGDIVETESGTREVVRQVQVVLGLSNGNNPTFDPGTEIVVFQPEDVPGRTEENHPLLSPKENT